MLFNKMHSNRKRIIPSGYIGVLRPSEQSEILSVSRFSKMKWRRIGELKTKNSQKVRVYELKNKNSSL